MDENNLNLKRLKIGHNSYSSYTPRYPHSSLKKWMRQRVTRGFSDYDAWNLDVFYLKLIPESLRYLAKHSDGWPENHANSFEEWAEILNNLANDFNKLEQMFDDFIPCKGEKRYEEFIRFKDDVFKRFGDIFFALWT